ncbi:hypothetical protein Y032_0116g570 [Ancylostoma ceylanicum]|uniref:Uncharacterized protein n=1 Tax=Ancylostoma ceylanicum TaxID=53326 RepID=A0A016TBH6_9BILA|nr:hypothetical protein Y032_0116g570 [Ancylostoma ceylanicum]
MLSADSAFSIGGPTSFLDPQSDMRAAQETATTGHLWAAQRRRDPAPVAAPQCQDLLLCSVYYAAWEPREHSNS